MIYVRTQNTNNFFCAAGKNNFFSKLIFANGVEHKKRNIFCDIKIANRFFFQITFQIRHPNDETQCIVCPKGMLPDSRHVTCIEIPEEYLHLNSGWAIGAMAFSTTGVVLTCFVIGVFIRHNSTPIVRASGRELTYVLLTGILMCYLITYILVLKPTNVVCALQRYFYLII